MDIFFLRVPFLYCYVPFCCYCLPLASARLVEDVTGKSHHHLHQYFVLCFPSLALTDTISSQPSQTLDELPKPLPHAVSELVVNVRHKLLVVEGGLEAKLEAVTHDCHVSTQRHRRGRVGECV